MMRLLHAFVLALGELADRRVLAVLGKSMVVTLMIVAVLAAALWRGTMAVVENYAADWGGAGSLVGALLAVVAAWLLFRIVALAVLQFFADNVVRAVEARHYPADAVAARNVPLGEEGANAIGGAVRALLVNLVALPVGLLMLATGVGAAVWFWAVNAWLLGRELQDMVWLRHRPSRSAAPPLSGLTRFALGGIVAAMLLIPFANLLAPVLGAAMATHLVHGRRR